MAVARSVAVLVALHGLGVMPAAGQSLGLAPDRDLPGWLTRWSVLAPRADLPRYFPSASTALPVSLFPETPIGLFWTGANPAGLAGAVERARADLTAASANTSGTYRRPLDPGGIALKQLSATAWTPVSSRLSMLGRVVLDQERFDPGSRSDETEPYPSSPFVTTDSSTTPTRRTRARLEGVAGWRLGQWALGADLGYDARENQTIEAGFVRRSLQAMPGLAVGVTRRLGGVQMGLTGRYRYRAETIFLTERAAEGQVIDLHGYREVTPISVQQSYYRRNEEGVRSAGVGLSGSLGARARWVLFGERAGLRERRTVQQQDQPAVDRWNADNWTVGGAYQRSLGSDSRAADAGRRWRLTVDGRYTTLAGKGDLALDSAGTVFLANERAFEGLAELRLVPAAGGWTGLVALSTRLERRVRNDSVALIGSAIRTGSVGFSLELGRAVSRTVTVIGTAALVSQASVATIPNPLVQRAVYRRLLAPELDFSARDVAPLAFGGLIRWEASRHTGLWLGVRTETVSPRGATGPTGFSPNGTRSVTSVVFGVVQR